MPESIIYPSIDLFLYDLKDGLGEDENKIDQNCQEFCRKIYGDLPESEFQQKLNQFLNHKNQDGEDVELLETRTRKFNSPLDGYYYPLQVNDTYSLLVDYSGKLDANGKPNDNPQDIDDQPFFKLKQEVYQYINQQPGNIGQTWLIWGKLTTPKTDNEIEVIAQKCYTQVVNNYNWQRDLIGQGRLGDGLIFELWYVPQNLGVEGWEFWEKFKQSNHHVLIWLFPENVSLDEMIKQVKSVHQDFLRLWQYRHKIVWAFYQSRYQKHLLKKEYIDVQPAIKEARELTKLLQENQLQLNHLQTTSTENLINLSDYTIALNFLENQSHTIQVNLENYKDRLADMEKKFQKYPNSDLDFLKRFSEGEVYAQKYQRQVEADLSSFQPGLTLLENLNNTIQGIIDIEQAKRDRSLNNTIASAGIGLATSQIAVSVILTEPPAAQKNPTLYQIGVFSLSLVIGLIFTVSTYWILRNFRRT
ncbi:MAG TPA: hypothetical protein VK184_24655 [Nostocaceae cyanobacterium]|nr:hypothetical protein [Nostocaceae cyanobacterium]